MAKKQEEQAPLGGRVEVAEEAKEVIYVVFYDVRDTVLGVMEATTFPTKAELFQLLKQYNQEYGKAVTAKIDKRYTL